MHTCFLISSLAETERLIGILKLKFGLVCRLYRDRGYFYIYIDAFSVSKFNDLVMPFVVPCTKVKLHNPFKG